MTAGEIDQALIPMQIGLALALSGMFVFVFRQKSLKIKVFGAALVVLIGAGLLFQQYNFKSAALEMDLQRQEFDRLAKECIKHMPSGDSAACAKMERMASAPSK